MLKRLQSGTDAGNGGFLDSRVGNEVIDQHNAIENAKIVLRTDVKDGSLVEWDGKSFLIPSPDLSRIIADLADVIGLKPIVEALQIQIGELACHLSNSATDDLAQQLADLQAQADDLQDQIDSLQVGSTQMEQSLADGKGFQGVDGTSDKGINEWVKNPANAAMMQALGINPADMVGKSPEEQVQTILSAIAKKAIGDENDPTSWAAVCNILQAEIEGILLLLNGLPVGMEAEARARLVTILSSEQLYGPFCTNIGIVWTTLAAADDPLDYVLKNATVTEGQPWITFWDNSTLASALKEHCGKATPPQGLVRKVYEISDDLKGANSDISNLQAENTDRVAEITELEARVTTTEGDISTAEGKITSLEQASWAAIIANTANDAIWVAYGLTGAGLRAMTPPEQTLAIFTAISNKLTALNLVARVQAMENYLSTIDTKIVALPVTININAGTGDAPIEVTPFQP